MILRETKTTSSSGRFACKLSLSVLLLLHTGGGFELVSVFIYLYARKIINLSECAISFFLLLI